MWSTVKGSSFQTTRYFITISKLVVKMWAIPVWFWKGVAATSRHLVLMSLPWERETGMRRLKSPREPSTAFKMILDPHSCSR